MKHCVTVWTDGLEILDWINAIVSFHFGKRFQMMHMNKAFSNFSICGLEIEVTNTACVTVVGQTSVASR